MNTMLQSLTGCHVGPAALQRKAIAIVNVARAPFAPV
jgi:hypothetical protein